MQEITKQLNQINYQECDKGDFHESELLNMICIDQKCNNRGLICNICYDLDHIKHKTTPLKTFLTSIYEKEQQETSLEEPEKDFENFLIDIQQIHQQNLHILKQFVGNFSTKIKNLEECLNKSYKKMQELLLTNIQIMKNKTSVLDKIIGGEIKNIKDLNQSVVNLLDQDNYSQQSDKSKPQSVSQTLLKSLRVLSDGFKLQMDSYESQSEKSFQSFTEQIEKVEKISLTDQISGSYSFIAEKKSESIELSNKNKNAVQKTNQNYESRFVLVEPVLSEVTPSHIAIKANISNWVGIGICYSQTIQNNNYNFKNNGQIGHGSYLISHNKYCWSHHDKNNNQKTKSFEFYNNDIVLIKYEPSENSVYFLKKSKPSDKFTIKLGLDSKDKEKAFCANLCSVNDGVEIVEFDQAWAKLFSKDGNNAQLAQVEEDMGGLFGDEYDDYSDEL